MILLSKCKLIFHPRSNPGNRHEQRRRKVRVDECPSRITGGREVAIKRRALPEIRLEVDYEFLGEMGSQSLTSLFGEQSQLLMYHFMFHPDWDEGCKSCSFWADSFDAAIAHLSARDVAFAIISRGPLEKLLAYRQRMGWSFPWLSSASSTFNYDFDVSFTPEQMADKSATYNYADGARPFSRSQAGYRPSVSNWSAQLQ